MVVFGSHWNGIVEAFIVDSSHGFGSLINQTRKKRKKKILISTMEKGFEGLTNLIS